MREISFVRKLKFKLNGSVAKNALVIGDADNDQRNELVCANLQGDLAVFKDKNSDSFAYASNLGMVTASVIGDIINSGKNYIGVINAEGWLFVFDVNLCLSNRDKIDQSSPSSNGFKLMPFYEQRMPANCKEFVLADLDGDGQNEVIIGLTDRVLRTYKWIKIGCDRGKFVGLYKWEFADQIGAVSLNSSPHKNCQDIIVAQPGGTYAKLECFDKKPLISSNSTSSSSNEPKQPTNSTGDDDNVRTEYISELTPEYHQLAIIQMRNHHISTVILGGIRDSKGSDSHSSIVIATLDGTLMLVNKDEILWSLQVDHQLFALSVLETTNVNEDSSSSGLRKVHQQPKLTQSESTCTIVPNINLMNRDEHCHSSNEEADETERSLNLATSQYFVVCAWNGKTYIIDEERNYLRFKFDEAVSAFTAGNYYFDKEHHASLVYATFNNQIVLYFDVIQDQIKPMYLLDEVINTPDNPELLDDIRRCALLCGYITEEQYKNLDTTKEQSELEDHGKILIKRRMHSFLNDLLYNLTDEDLIENNIKDIHHDVADDDASKC